MAEIISLSFAYRDVVYYSLVRIKSRAGQTEYHITIMNGELEKLLYGNHIIYQKDGQLVIDVPAGNTAQAKIKFEIAKALNTFLDQQEIQNETELQEK